METTSTQDVLPQAPSAATPQPPPMSKPRDTGVSLPSVNDDREPAHSCRRAEPLGAPSARHGWRRLIVAAGGVVTLAALVVGSHYYVAARGHETTEAAVDGYIVHVAPQVAGRVLQVLVTDNQPVQAGDLLIQIDPLDFSMKLTQSLAVAAEAYGLFEQARWQLLAAEAAQALTEVEVVSARAPRKNTAAKRPSSQLTVAQLKATVAAAQVNLARAQVATAEAGVAAAEAALMRAGLDLVETEVRAPRSGRVMTTNVKPGEYVQVGEDFLALVSDDLADPANLKANQHPTRPLAVSLED